MKQATSIDMILAGGQGKRLWPITRDRAKPAAPFGGTFRIIDFVLSNHANSGSEEMVVLVQYKPTSLKRHIQHAWEPEFRRRGKEFIQVVQPAHQEYKGTADAVYQNLKLIEKSRPYLVSVFAGDHVYLMDTSQMKRFHLDSRTDLTISAVPVKKSLAAGNLGVLVVNDRGEVVDFQEKVPNPAEIPGLPGHCWASMGNYVFNRETLVGALSSDAKKFYVPPEQKETVAANPDSYTSGDFGFDIIPMLIRQGKRVKMYDFRNNHPDLVPTTGYWRDVGTLDQFVEANMDLTGIIPVLTLAFPGWPIITYDESHGKPIKGAESAIGCVLAKGVDNRGHLRRSVVSYNSMIGRNSYVEDAILMGDNGVGNRVRIRNAVLDKGVKVRDGTVIDMSAAEAASRGFVMSPGGNVFIPRNYKL